MNARRKTSAQHADPRAVPMYAVSEAAAYLGLSAATLRSWVAGRDYATRSGVAYSKPLIRLPDPKQRYLSFENLIEAHVLWSLRVRHSVPMPQVRTAISYAERELAIDRLLLSKDLLAGAGDVFLAKYGELLSLSKAGQIAMRKVLEIYLARIEWDAADSPARFFPLLLDGDAARQKIIVIDPAVGFGRPRVARVGISTTAITDRIDAGESATVVAEDYGLKPHELQAALLLQTAA